MFWRPAAAAAAAAPAPAPAPAPPAAAAAGRAAELALFVTGSRRDVKPRGSMFLEVVPSFSGMVFRCGEGCVLEAYSSSCSSRSNDVLPLGGRDGQVKSSGDTGDAGKEDVGSWLARSSGLCGRRSPGRSFSGWRFGRSAHRKRASRTAVCRRVFSRLATRASMQ